MPYLNIRRIWEDEPPYKESKTFFYTSDEAEAQTAADAEPRGAEGWKEETCGTVDISAVTRTILRNFLALSNSLLLVEGRRQQTRYGTAVLAVAELPDVWPQRETAIYDLASFLRVLSDYTTPSIQCEHHAMVISEPTSMQKVTYRYSDPTTIRYVSPKSFPHDHPSVEFTLSGTALAQLKKKATILKLTTMLVRVDQGQVVITVSDPRIPTSHAFDITIPAEATTVHDPKFSKSFRFGTEHILLLLKGSYAVTLADWPYGFFAHKTIPVSYYIATKGA